MERKVIKVGTSVAPYSPAVVVGPFVYTAGQIGLDPATKQLVEGGIRAQVEQALKNLGSVLAAAGTSLDQVVKTTVFLADMDDYAVMNEIYARVFDHDEPARSAVQVARLPLDALVEIEAIAVLPS